MKRSSAIWVAAGVLAVAAGGGLVYLRSQQVVTGSPDPAVRSLLTQVLPAGQNIAGSSALPWEAPDLQWTWAPAGEADGLPEGSFAWQPLGLLSLVGTPEPSDPAAWWASFQRSPLALPGRGDDELVSALFFAADQALPPQATAAMAALWKGELSAGLGADGLLAADHPWKPAVEVLRTWRAQGVLAAGWTDWSGDDAVAAVIEGRAVWAVVAADRPLSRAGTGIRATVLRPLPVHPGRSSGTALGRALTLRSGAGWASADRVKAFTGLATASETARLWFVRGGLVLTGDLPAVDQESKALGLALRSSGRFVALPAAGAGLERAQALLEVVRTELRR